MDSGYTNEVSVYKLYLLRDSYNMITTDELKVQLADYGTAVKDL